MHSPRGGNMGNRNTFLSKQREWTPLARRGLNPWFQYAVNEDPNTEISRNYFKIPQAGWVSDGRARHAG